MNAECSEGVDFWEEDRVLLPETDVLDRASRSSHLTPKATQSNNSAIPSLPPINNATRAANTLFRFCLRHHKVILTILNLLGGIALFVTSESGLDIALCNPCNSYFNALGSIRSRGVPYKYYITNLGAAYCIGHSHFTIATTAKAIAFEQMMAYSQSLAKPCVNVSTLQALHDQSIESTTFLGLEPGALDRDLNSSVHEVDDLEKYNFGDLIGDVIPKYLEEILHVRRDALASLSGNLSLTRKEIELHPRPSTNALYYSLAPHRALTKRLEEASAAANLSLNAVKMKMLEGEDIFKEFESLILVIANQIQGTLARHPNTFFSSTSWLASINHQKLTHFQRSMMQWEPRSLEFYTTMQDVRNQLAHCADDPAKLLFERARSRSVDCDDEANDEVSEIEELEKILQVQKDVIADLIAVLREERKKWDDGRRACEWTRTKIALRTAGRLCPLDNEDVELA